MTAPANVRTCYRHPDRVAGIVCQRCDRPICPSCMQQASVGFHCPECATKGAQREYRGAAALRNRPIVTQALIGINLLVYLAMLATRTVEPFSTWGQAFAARYEDVLGLYADGLLFGPSVPDEPWRLITGGFLHDNAFPGGVLHVALNMWGLWIFGRLLEPMLGRAAFVTLYLTALAGGSLGVVLIDPTSFTIGASGAVYGLLGALGVVAWRRGVDLVRSGLATTLVIWVLFSFAPGVSLAGHFGGLATGAVAALVLVEAPPRLGPRGTTLSIVITGALGVALLIAGYVVMASEYGSI